MDLEQIGAVPTGVATLVVKVLGSQVTVRRAEREDIAFRANNLDSWRLTEAGIEQVKVVGGSGDISFSGISIGSVSDSGISGCQINGRLLTANADGVFIDGKKQKNDRKLTFLDELKAKNKNTMTAGRWKIQSYDGVLYVNGYKQVDDVPEGEDAAEAAEPEKPKDPDEIEVLVPYSFSGGLDIDFQGDRQLTITDEWVGGDFSLAAADRTSVTLEGAVRAAGEFLFDFAGSGKASLKDVSCASGKVAVGDRASFAMGALAIVANGSGKPQPFKIRQNSSNSATFGDIGGPADLSVKLSERGALVLGNVDTAAFNMEENGSGSATVGNVTTMTFGSDRNERGALQMGFVRTDSARINHNGSNKAQLAGITCLAALAVEQTERGALGLGKVCCDAFALTITGSGGATTDGIECSSLTGELTDRGSWTMGDAQVANRFKLEQTGSGGVNGGKVTCREFDYENTDRGSTTFASVLTGKATIDSSGSGNLTISGGGAESGKVENSDRGTITLVGNFKSLRQERSGRGQIIVA